MTEFETSAIVDISVSSSSLREVRQEVENGIPDVKVDASTATNGGSGGGRMAGRERAMGRQIMTRQADTLDSIDGYGDENLALNEERNDLLRELVDINEKDAQSGRGGIPGGGMIAGGLGLAAGGIALGSMVLSDLGDRLGEALPDLDPSDVVETVALEASDVIDSAANVSASDAIDSAADIAPSDIVTEALTLTPGTIIASSAVMEAGDVIASMATIAPGDVVAEMADVSPGDIVAEAASIGVGDVIVSAVELVPGDLIAAAVELAPTDIVSGTVSADDILDHITDPSAEPAGDAGDDGRDWLPWIAGGLAAGGAAAGSHILGSGGSIGGGAAGGAAGAVGPVFTPAMFREDLEGLEGTIFDERHVLHGSGAGDFGGDPAHDPDQWSSTPTDQGDWGSVQLDPDQLDGGNELHLDIDNIYELDAEEIAESHRKSEREIRREIEELKRQIEGR